MYGFVNSALEKLIKRRFGVEKWEEIRSHANVVLGETDAFQVNHVYKDDDTYAVVTAASEVLGLPADTILEMFGEQFLLWCQESGYAKTLQLLGRSLQDFLTNLDALHDHLSIIYPQMDAPSFRCTAGMKKSEFLLHYYSDRVGLENIVMGIVKSVAREYYNVEVEMKLLRRKGTDSDHSIFSIREVGYHSKNVADGEAEQEVATASYPDRQLISSQTFCKAFPFHIIFDSEMHILQVGSSLELVLPNFKQSEKKLTNYFALERPRMKLTFANIQAHINTIFILRMVLFGSAPPPTQSSSNHKSDRLSFSLTTGKDPMRLRGQMIYVPESDAMLFLCSPRVKRLHDLEQRGLYLSDIPIHDATRGLLMMGQAAEAEFSNAVHLEDLIIELRAVQKSLEDEKRRMSDLLHEMLPITVADSLMAGQMVEAERFESVTILFSDIVGFTSICSLSEPMQVVNMLNKLYSMFDQVVGQNRVYKVETIGDAYMVVGGLPERNETHAECVANQALDMMHYCQQVPRPDNGEKVVMRIGIHSGAVVAGVVGLRMPRYCLFGNTVNVASRTESNGTPGKIQITEFTQKLLSSKPNYKFEFREALNFKNVPEPVRCYYLVENTAREEFVPIVVTDEVDQITYQFITPRLDILSPTTPRPIPPPPPHSTNGGSPLPAEIQAMLKCPFGPHSSSSPPPPPDITIHNATPNETPASTPPPHTKVQSHFTHTAEASTHTAEVSTQSEEEKQEIVRENDSGGVTKTTSCPDFTVHMRPVDLEIPGGAAAGGGSQFMESMRKISLSPLREDSNEDSNGTDHEAVEGGRGGQRESTTKVNGSSENEDQGIVIVARKISDVSVHSVHSFESSTSGVDSGKLSDTSKESISVVEVRRASFSSTDTETRKFSDSSTEEEIGTLTRKRAGSVGKRVEMFNSWARHRKTGLTTTNPPNMELSNVHDTSSSPASEPLPVATTSVVDTSSSSNRPNRKSLDSIGSSGSND